MYAIQDNLHAKLRILPFTTFLGRGKTFIISPFLEDKFVFVCQVIVVYKLNICWQGYTDCWRVF